MSSGVFAGGRIDLQKYQKIALAAEKWGVQQQFEKTNKKFLECKTTVEGIMKDITKLEEEKKKFKHGTHDVRHEARQHKEEIGRLEGALAGIEESCQSLERDQKEVQDEIRRTKDQVEKNKIKF